MLIHMYARWHVRRHHFRCRYADLHNTSQATVHNMYNRNADADGFRHFRRLLPIIFFQLSCAAVIFDAISLLSPPLLRIRAMPSFRFRHSRRAMPCYFRLIPCHFHFRHACCH